MRKKLCTLFNETSKVVDYQQTWRYQKVLTEHAGVERKRGYPVPDSLILVQHQSLYTLGRGATLGNLKFSPLAQGYHHGNVWSSGNLIIRNEVIVYKSLECWSKILWCIWSSAKFNSSAYSKATIAFFRLSSSCISGGARWWGDMAWTRSLLNHKTLSMKKPFYLLQLCIPCLRSWEFLGL